jgi:hypothetical protein
MKFVDMFESYKVYHDKKGYAIIWINNKNIKLHVYLWERKNGKKPVGYDIHHIDENKGNYVLNNLELLSKQDHSKLHAGWVKTDGMWSHKICSNCLKLLPLSDFYNRKPTPSAKCKKCALICFSERYKDIMLDDAKAVKLRYYKKIKAREYYKKKVGDI